MKWTLATAALALLFVGVAAVSGQHAKGALVGAGIAGVTGLASMLAIGKTAGARKPMQVALAIMTVGFLVRLVLVALGTVLVATRGESVIAFVVAFFVPFFVFAALEAAHVHSLRHGTGAA
ncbi:MAG: hypothetical protein QM704_04540 [Anaeromyxobacteraceae bacterium]